MSDNKEVKRGRSYLHGQSERTKETTKTETGTTTDDDDDATSTVVAASEVEEQYSYQKLNYIIIVIPKAVYE